MLTKEEARRHDNIFINELAATLEDKELGKAHLNFGIRYEPILIGLENITPRGFIWSYWTSLSDILWPSGPE